MKNFKKIISVLFVAALLFGFVATNTTEAKASYITKHHVFAFDNTCVGWNSVYAYVWNDSEDARVFSSSYNKDGIYYFDVYGQYDNVLFKTTNDTTTWYMQTADLKMPTDKNYCFKPYNGFNKTNGYWFYPATELEANVYSYNLKKGYSYFYVDVKYGVAPYTLNGTISTETSSVEISEESDYTFILSYGFYSSGNYKFDAVITDATGAQISVSKNLYIPPLTVTDVTPSTETGIVGEEVSFEISVDSAWFYKVPARVIWTIEKDGKTFVDHEFNYGLSTYKWTPSEAGVYTINLTVKDSTSESATYQFDYTVENKVEDNRVKIYYVNSSWSNVFIHYAANSVNWTDGHGVKMLSSDDPKYRYMYTFELSNSDIAKVCFNNGEGEWDSKNAQNYIVEKGTYAVVYGQLYKLSDIVND